MAAAPEKLVFAQQQLQPLAVTDAELRQWAQALGQDVYGLKQRLQGYGPVFLGEVAADQWPDLQRQLQGQGLAVCTLDQWPAFLPAQRVLGLQASAGGLQFQLRGATLELRAASGVLLLWADASGRLMEKQLQRQVARHLYSNPQQRWDEQQLWHQLWHGQPLLDIIWQPNQQLQRVRLWPGRFDPSGLEQSGGYTGRQNLTTVADLIEKRAGHCQQDMAFGFAKIPGCRLATSGAQKDWAANIEALDAYGGIAWALHQACPRQMAKEPSPAAADKVTSAGSTAVSATPEALSATDALPLPPESAAAGVWQRLKGSWVGESGLGGLLLALAVMPAYWQPGSLISLLLPALVGFMLVFTAVYGIIIYNGLISLRHNADKAWSNIDVLLKQRFDEVPKLVEVCKGYMEHERQTLQQVIAARSGTQTARNAGDQLAAENMLSQTLKSLFAVSEQYPDLKADSAFQRLSQRISQIEETIADRREFYNDSVNNYNIRIAQIPDLLVARLAAFQPLTLWQIEPEQRADVSVSFAGPAAS